MRLLYASRGISLESHHAHPPSRTAAPRRQTDCSLPLPLPSPAREPVIGQQMQERSGEAGRLRPGHRGAGRSAGLVRYVSFTHCVSCTTGLWGDTVLLSPRWRNSSSRQWPVFYQLLCGGLAPWRAVVLDACPHRVSEETKRFFLWYLMLLNSIGGKSTHILYLSESNNTAM